MSSVIAFSFNMPETGLLHASLDSMDSGIAVYDADLRLITANARFLSLRGLPPRFAEPGSDFADQVRFRAQRGEFGDADPDTVVAEMVALVKRGEHHRLEHLQPDGTWLAIRGNPLPEGGFITTYTDITEFKRMELALRERERELERLVLDADEARSRFEGQAGEMAELAESVQVQVERAEAADRAKSEFLANASHELRTPLTSIIGFSHLAKKKLAKGASAEDVCDLVGHILESGEHLLELINDVLDVSKVESGKDELVEEVFEVAGMVDSVIRLVHQRADGANLKLTSDFGESAPRLFADKRKTKQILVNLLTNAIKFTPDGGSVALSVFEDVSEGLAFRVADTGIGMAPEDIPKALSVFGQIDSDQGRKHVGTGLGLPLSRSLAELQGGALEVESEPGKGTQITLRFPAVRSVRD